ncbi:MAG TPA: hypothetical protein VEN78_12085, partial [Bradyrhizobium sp.]|nr:hypothetical protein [Bradyrhizobium sp.]
MLDVALFIGPGRIRILLWRIRRPEQISFAAAKVGRIGSHGVFERRCKRKHLIFDLDGTDSVFGEILTFSSDDRDRFTLKIQLFAQRLGNNGGRTAPRPDWHVALPLRSVLVRQDVGDTRHLFCRRSIDVLDPRVRM